MRGKIGINAAFYIGHCALRRYVMGEDAQDARGHRRRDRADGGARHRGDGGRRRRASAPPTRPPTSTPPTGRCRRRLSSLDELKALTEAAGRAGGGSRRLPARLRGRRHHARGRGSCSSRCRCSSRMPVIIQGLGARSKVDAPTAGWDNAKRFVDEATAQGAAVYSMAMSKPFNRTFNLADGTKLYEGALQLNRLFTEASTVDERLALIADPAFRDAVRDSVDHPNRDPDAGPTLPPPGWAVLHVNKVTQAREREAARPLARRHRRRARRAPHRRLPRHRRRRGPRHRVPLEDRDAGVDRGHQGRPGRPAHDRRHLRRRRPPRPRRRRRGPHLVPRSTGCASGRASPSRRACARSPPSPPRCAASPTAASLLPGYAADIMIFDPDTVGPDQKWLAHDFPNGAARWTSQAQGRARHHRQRRARSSSTASSRPTPASPARSSPQACAR